MERRDLISLSLYSLLSSNRGGLFVVFLPLYLVALKGAPLTIALIILSAAYVPASLISPLVGRLSDQLGRRRPFLLVGEAASLPLFLGMIVAPGYLLAGGCFVAAELALAIGGPAYSAYVADVTRAEERGSGYGLLNATSNAGGVAGFLGAGVVTAVFGLEALVPFVVAVTVGSFAVVLLLVPDRPVVVPHLAPRPLSELKPVVIFSVAVSIRALGSGAVGTYYGYLAGVLGANTFEVSLVAIAGLLTAALVSLPLGRWIDRRGEIRGIWYGTVLSLVSYGVFFFAARWQELVPAQAVRAAGLALLGPGMLAWVARFASPHRRAESLGVFSFVNSTAWSCGPLVGALAIALAGEAGLFVMAFATTVASLVVMEVLYGEMGIRARLSRRPANGSAP